MPSFSFLLVALTSLNSQDLFNYERLEFLGDAFLAFSIAVELYLHEGSAHENLLSQRKSAIVSNLNLYRKGRRRKLWKYIIEEKFNFKNNKMIERVCGIGPQAQLKNGAAEPTCEQKPGLIGWPDIADGSKEQRDSSELGIGPSDITFQCHIGNKLISDCVEALIGVFYIHDSNAALDLMTWLGLNVCCVRKRQLQAKSNFVDLCRYEESTVTKLAPDCGLKSNFKSASSFGGSFIGEDVSKSESNDRQTPDFSLQLNGVKFDGNSDGPVRTKNTEFTKHIHMEVEFPTYSKVQARIPPYIFTQLAEFERILGYEFKSKEVLVEALLHPSYLCKFSVPVHCNQRLEFVGDSILYLLTTDYLCRKYPHSTNAELTSMRCIVINTKSLAKIAYTCSFHKFLLALSPSLSESILTWSKTVQKERDGGDLWPKVNCFIRCSSNLLTLFLLISLQ